MNIRQQLIDRVVVPPASPEEPRSREYRGMSTVADQKGFKLYDFDLIKQDIVNHFHIRQGERLSDPSFGTIIWDVLWEPFTQEIKQAVADNVTQIVNYDPRVSASLVTVNSYEHGMIVECRLTFIKYNITETMRFNFDQRNGLS